MVSALRAARGGFQRPFGCARFILDFLQGFGPNYSVASIDPTGGAPQTDILSAYKTALHLDWAEDRVEADPRIVARMAGLNINQVVMQSLERM